MNDPTQFDAGRVRVALDHGEVVELDGGTLVLDGEESASVVLRLTPWRARALSWVLEEWSAISRVFNRPPRLSPDELDLSRVLELASSVAGDESDEPAPVVRFLPPGRSVPNRARLAAVAVLAERESRLNTIQRLALVDAASWWLSEAHGGQQLAHALLEAACIDDVAAEHAYLALITPPDSPEDSPGNGAA
ncbi:MAG TPA: hypothetical protein VLJ59_04910 [Mycobacteriales bacterium]|nr:hypothetical protein [Mycobacteriales bacterium]